MINHINKKSLDILVGIMNQQVDNIFSQKSFLFTPDRSQKKLDENNDNVIYIQIKDSYIEIVNDYIETEEYDEYPNFEVKRCIRMSEDTDYHQIVSNNINGIIEQICIVNDEFTTFYSDEINSIDIAIKITISGHDYYIIAWDAIQGNLSFIDKSVICEEDFYVIRNQISKFWINKDIDLRYFYRKEIPISDRIIN
ncbi:hypothetical protein [Veillonella sp.]|jgi:hypothetical protein|uniref:hypothetical protein n=1 Tax=Veillonella sp. TaxID=1926307 RepID=UPI002911754A|nr:hypothetical protein [Veillonella sp.]MDU6206277.1 hypothetical protein [Veillonella sp.]